MDASETPEMNRNDGPPDYGDDDERRISNKKFDLADNRKNINRKQKKYINAIPL